MISRFNLLPHRAQKQMWHKRALARQVGLVLTFAFLTAMLIHVCILARLDYLEAYNRELQFALMQIIPASRASQQLLKQREDMLERQKVLERLDARRSASVMILDDVARALPSDVYLTRLEEDGEMIRLEGKAVSNVTIVKFFESLVKSERLSGLALEEIRTQEGEGTTPYLFLINGRIILGGAGDSLMAGRLYE